MNIIEQWRERREREWWNRWHREHRWDRLGRYNAERYRGIVHTAQYDLLMAEEQRQFNEEHYGDPDPSGGGGFPITLEPGDSVGLHS